MADKTPTNVGEADTTVLRTGANAPSASRPHHPLMTLRDEVDRLFETFFPATFGRSLFELDPWRDRAFGRLGDIAPRMDVAERGDHYDVTVELPGMDEKDVAVKVQRGLLVISGEKKAERTEDSGAMHLTERSFGSFVRTVRLPEDCNPDAIRADFARGVLTVSLPKRPEGKGEKKIEVTTH